LALKHCITELFHVLGSYTFWSVLEKFRFSDPAGFPKIQGLEEGEVLAAGNLKRLTCTSIAGNPLATLKWFVGDKELASTYLTRDNYASAELSYVPKWSDNGASIRCEATNPAMTKPEVAIRVLDIDFAPELVKIYSRPENPRAGLNITLVCETAPSRPAAAISWWHNGEKLGKGLCARFCTNRNTSRFASNFLQIMFFLFACFLIITFIEKFPDGYSDTVVDGDNGGHITSSHLTLTLTAQHHGAVITCEAMNEVMGKRVQDSFTFSVRRE